MADQSQPHHYHMAAYLIESGCRYSTQKRLEHDKSISEIFSLFTGEEVIAHFTNSCRESLLRYGDKYVSLIVYNDAVWIHTYAQTAEAAAQLLEELKALIPVPTPPDETQILVNFWMQGLDGKAVSRTNRLKAPDWSEISSNYQSSTHAALSELMELQTPSLGGKLLLLHGKPGGGKSYAIRALSKKWAPWCDTHYLIDPDRFFSCVQYMYEVLLSQETVTSRYKLIVCEDSDEFIRGDAKNRTGQGLARLLNLADGILGQGMKIIILLTTNEPLSALHPAVIRPGRCLANIEFRTFSRSEATQWLGHEPTKKGSEFSLAELFDEQQINKTDRSTQIMPEKELVSQGMYL